MTERDDTPIPAAGDVTTEDATAGQHAATDGHGQARTITAAQTVVPVLPAALDHALDHHVDDRHGDDLRPIDPTDPRALAEDARVLLRANIRAPLPAPAPGRWFASFVWGLAQPLLGLRLLLRHGELFVRAIAPVAALLLLGWLVARSSEVTGFWGFLSTYYATLVGAAQISPVLFTKSYAKLAADARRHLDVPRHQPYLRSYGQALVESVVQLIVIGVGVAPLVGLISQLPLLGSLWAALLGWIWLVHWIVVEALDSARTLAPDSDPASLERRHALLDPPWYAAPMAWHLRGVFALLLLPLRLWCILLARLGRRWRGEVLVVETRPAIAAGFGLGTSLLLAIPVLNLLLRPAIVIAASHVLGRLEAELELPDDVDDDEDDDGAAPREQPSDDGALQAAASSNS